jgi:hypothetical protein
MSDCQNAAPDAAKPASRRNAVRRAWRWVGAYALVEVCFYVYFEWRNAVSGIADDAYPFFDGFAFLFFLGASLILFTRSLVRREKAAALIYAALFAIGLAWPRTGTALDLTAKAYFFSAFPQMCPEGSPKPGYRVFLCYKYWLMESRTALVFNPGDELAAPYTSWPPEFDKEIFENVPVTECRKKKTSLLVNHVYIVADHCWGDWATD